MGPSGHTRLLWSLSYLVMGGVAIMMGSEETEEYNSKQKTAITPATRSSLFLAVSIAVAEYPKSWIM